MKTIDEIYEDMLSCCRELTGLSLEGTADLAVRLRALAAEVCSLYVYAQWVRKQCFPQTAGGEQLDLHAQLRGLERRSAAFAGGVIRFYVNEAPGADISIPAGTVCMDSSMRRYETTEDGVLAAGELWVDVPAVALIAGKEGNASAGAVNIMGLGAVGIAGCSNPNAFSGGEDEEDDESLRERVLDSFRRLPNGANAAFYENRALECEGVGAVNVIPRINGIGTVGVVVAGSSGQAVEGLAGKVAQELQSIREIAVDVTVMDPEELEQDVSVAISVKSGWTFDTVAAEVQDALGEFFNGELLGKDLLRAALGQVVFGVDGVENYKILVPADDVEISDTQIARPGTISVSNMEVS